MSFSVYKRQIGTGAYRTVWPKSEWSPFFRGRPGNILADSSRAHQNVAPTESGEVANQPQLIQVSRSNGPLRYSGICRSEGVDSSTECRKHYNVHKPPSQLGRYQSCYSLPIKGPCVRIQKKRKKKTRRKNFHRHLMPTKRKPLLSAP